CVVLRQGVEQAADAGRVHLDTDVVSGRVQARGVAQRLAIAEADFQDPRRLAAEGGIEIARAPLVVEAEARPQRVERALLGRGEAALAQHEAAHGAMPRLYGERLAIRCPRGTRHPPTRPS